MPQINYNKFIRITFDRNVNSLSLVDNLRAFSLRLRQRDHYSGPLYTTVINPISIMYALDTLGNPYPKALILKFSDTSNFRKAEGTAALVYTSIYGNLYGEQETDRLGSFDLAFTPQNMDMYQNPFTSETVKLLVGSSNTLISRPAHLDTCSPSAETVKLLTNSSRNATITQIGQIKP